jgi:glucosylceramidase
MSTPTIDTMTVELYLTARGTGDRLSGKASPPRLDGLSGAKGITLHPEQTYQEILGFGGAFTEAAAVTYAKLSPNRQRELMNAYFSRAGGHGYTLCRTHINSCDFSLGNYAYADTPGDTELTNFSIERDRTALLPMIKQAKQIMEEPMTLFASPWSPPAWMKTNGAMNGGGKLKPEYRTSWARYYARYIKAYAEEGVDIWGITVQNEPAATQTWDSCVYTAEEERDFVRDYLGPVMREEKLGDRKIIIWDHNRDGLVDRANTILSDPKAAQFIWGTGFHWYGPDDFDNVQKVHDAFPDKHLIFTEGCQEGGPHTGSWNLGERYARSMINDLNRWTVGWVDWNLMLDSSGGPNHVGNLCSAPILADLENDALLYQSSYYYIGHFSRFVRPGARRIGFTLDKPGIEATAFKNTDHSISVILLNQGEQPVQVPVTNGDHSVKVTLPARSIATVLFHTAESEFITRTSKSGKTT